MGRLVAAVPVLTLAVAYARITHFQTDLGWAAAAVALTAALTATAATAARESRHRAGIHAAGAVAALALGCACCCTTTGSRSLSLVPAPLAWIEARAELPPLRPAAWRRRPGHRPVVLNW